MDIMMCLLMGIVLMNAIILAKMDKIQERKIDALINVIFMMSALYGFIHLLPSYLGAK